ncbi:MAG: UDP-N-acetylmuramoyl-tripeptide--D-alanyl-D-alanine ligase [Bacteroidota bacterium]
MELYEKFKSSTGLTTDSRQITPGCMFLALRGENFDGNRFAAAALDQGAHYAVVDDPKIAVGDDRYILVEDTLPTLQALSTTHRLALRELTVIAVAGSNGKTTTKELLHRVLSRKAPTFATPGNWNNHIGVPLSLLSLTEEHHFAVIEIGANHQRENALLCEIARPDFGLVTNCGKDHLEGFGGVAGVIQANKEVYDHLRAVGRPAFVNQDDPVLMEISAGVDRILYGSNTGQITQHFPSITYQAGPLTVATHLLGSFQQYNIASAIAVGREFGVADVDIAAALGSYIPRNNRSQVIDWQGNRLLLDAYNANPSSMSAMIADFRQYPVENKVAVLGDMFELGEYSHAEHRLIIEQLRESGIGTVVLVGEEFLRQDSEFHHFATTAEFKAWLDAQRFSGHYFLVKGSRGIALEKAFLDESPH